MIDFGFGILLTTIDRSHLSKLRLWRNNPKVYKWCRQNDLINEVNHELWFDNQSKDLSIKMYLIQELDKAVGVCGLTSIDQLNRRAEFSLYIDPDRHGCGLGKKSLSTLVTHGFRNLGLNLIWGETFDDNPAAKMFEGLGFKLEGTRKEFYFRDGKFIDAHLYSLKASDWNK